MSTFKFPNPVTGQQVEIKGAPTLTAGQAKFIFDQQLKAGSLVGLTTGDVISATTQAADGLPGASAQVAQAISGRAGSAQGALQSTPAVGDLVPQTSTIFSRLSNSGLRSGALPVTNGINIADFARQEPALVPIQRLSVPDVTAAMSSASKLVGQDAAALSDNLGLGKFGLNAQQLESAGIIKPGTAATLLNQGQNTLTDVLKSPAVWTGKDGINNLDSLLNSVPKQDEIQQQLMSQGLNSVNQLGIPTDKLSVASLTGLANNTAKSVPDTLAWAQGLPLPADIQASLDTAARDGAFAADFATFKVDDDMKAEITPLPAENTVDRQTVDAASKRIVGNDKVPEFSYGATLPLNVKDTVLIIESKIALTSAQQTVIEQQLAEVRKTVTAATASEGIGILDELLGKISLVDSQYLEYKRLATQLNRIQSGSGDALLAKIASELTQVAGIRKRIESTLAKLRELAVQTTTA
jgi:hypothetical protein